MIAAVSRTSIVSLAVMTVAAVLLRPQLLPKVVLYGGIALLAAFTISARNIVAMVSELTDPQALIASQMTSPGWTGSGRLADLGPSLAEAASSPVVGTGLGSRVTMGDGANALILDDQYLTTLLESGALGVAALLVLMLVPFGRLAALSRRIDVDPDRQDLALAAALGILGYAVSLAFFDAFSFIQTLLMFFVLLAIGSWLLTGDRASRRSERALRLAEAVR
jgi:O-antigen ligase